MFLLENDTNNTPVYVAIVTGGFIILGSIVTWLLSRNKVVVEVEGAKGKNTEQAIKNIEIHNKVGKDTQGFVDELSDKVIAQSRQIHSLKEEKELETDLRKEAEGRAKAAFEDRDRFLERLRKVEKENLDLKERIELLERQVSEMRKT